MEHKTPLPLNKYLRKALYWAKWDRKDTTCWITGAKAGERGRLEGHHDGWSFAFIVAHSLEVLDLPYHKYITDYTKEELAQIKKEVLKEHELHAVNITLCEEIHLLLHQTYGEHVTHEQLMEFKDNYNKNNKGAVA